MPDNRIFNVNGITIEQLELAVKLLLLNEYGEQIKIRGWYFNPNKGLVLTWHVDKDSKAKPFTDNMGQEKPIEEKELVETLWNWLFTDQAKSVVLNGYDVDADHDGSNEKGWRLYNEEWGCVRDGEHTIDHYSVAAFTPAFLWYGK